MADCGVASRRKCEEIIRRGQSEGKRPGGRSAGLADHPGKDIVSVDGHRIALLQSRAYFAFYKPRGVVCTMQDERGRRCVGDYFARAKSAACFRWGGWIITAKGCC